MSITKNISKVIMNPQCLYDVQFLYFKTEIELLTEKSLVWMEKRKRREQYRYKLL